MRWICLAALTACGAPEAPPDGATLESRGIETQDRHLLGEAIDADPIPGAAGGMFLRWVYSTTVSVTGSGALRSDDGHVGTDPYFNGLLLHGPNATTRLTVLGGNAERALYKIELQRDDDPAGAWVDQCDGEGAIPFVGRWTERGAHVAGEKPFMTFACQDSAAVKCLTWGYLPGNDPDSPAWKAHEACTRMARADYCGNGKPHTYVETGIGVYGPRGVTPASFAQVDRWPPDAETYYFEAAWGPGGALCLDRMRWAGLGVGKQCGQVPPSCDGAIPAGALFVNTSRYDDLPLELWSYGGELVETVRGSDDQPPFPGYRRVAPDAIDGHIQRTPPSPERADLFAKLVMFRRGNDHVIAVADHGPLGFVSTAKVSSGVDVDFEGYIWKAPPPKGNALPLVLYHTMRPREDWVTTTHPEHLPAGYEPVQTLGYVRR